ncbi:MAG TPA: hypothetical protein VN626_04995 [Clostridia bacterium]|nr:hypothetical protein [Clostridia bacterium]
MTYINQLAYPDMSYPTNIDEPESDFATEGNVKRAGCGLCCSCMLIELLTLEHLALEECRDFSIEIRANHGIGTDMKMLAPAIAEKYGLSLRMTDDTSELLQCLRDGGKAIINVGGNRNGHDGTFSMGGHYILAVSATEREVCILDPSWTEAKFSEEPRKSRVGQCGYWLYCSPEVLEEDTRNRTPGYYLFMRSDVI